MATNIGHMAINGLQIPTQSFVDDLVLVASSADDMFQIFQVG